MKLWYKYLFISKLLFKFVVQKQNNMKITIELTNTEVKGIKQYLKDLGEENSKEDIKIFIQGIVSGTINAPQESVSHYINQN